MAEWTTDETGEFKLVGELIAGQVYTLHETCTVDGYYYSHDVEFTVNDDGREQVVEMRNREIKVVTPPDEFPPKVPENPDNPIIWLLKNEVGDRTISFREVPSRYSMKTAPS